MNLLLATISLVTALSLISTQCARLQVQSLKKKLEEALQASGPADESAVASPPPTNESPERRVTRQTAAKEPTTPMKETTNLELRRSARLEQKSPGKRSPQKRLSGPDAEQSPSGKRPLTAEGTSSQVPRCMVNTATGIKRPSFTTDLYLHKAKISSVVAH